MLDPGVEPRMLVKDSVVQEGYDFSLVFCHQETLGADNILESVDVRVRVPGNLRIPPVALDDAWKVRRFAVSYDSGSSGPLLHQDPSLKSDLLCLCSLLLRKE